jgi:hypothetical protein
MAVTGTGPWRGSLPAKSEAQRGAESGAAGCRITLHRPEATLANSRNAARLRETLRDRATSCISFQWAERDSTTPRKPRENRVFATRRGGIWGSSPARRRFSPRRAFRADPRMAIAAAEPPRQHPRGTAEILRRGFPRRGGRSGLRQPMNSRDRRSPSPPPSRMFGNPAARIRRRRCHPTTPVTPVTPVIGAAPATRRRRLHFQH